MHITFLGTADAWGYPDAFCGCERCTQARAQGGRSLRKRSAALINDDLLIDLGPDITAASMDLGVPLVGVRYCLQTHEHSDHFAPMQLLARGQQEFVRPELQFYASQGALGIMRRALEGDAAVRDDPDGILSPETRSRLRIAPHPVAPFETFTVGPYQVQSVRANHDPEHIIAMLYAIEQGGRSLFYGTDTGEIPAETWAALREAGRRFNVVVLDHTFGVRERAMGHMNGAQFLEQVARLRELNLLAPDARVFAQHIAHHSNPAYPELAAAATAHGYEIAYDGLVVSI